MKDLLGRELMVGDYVAYQVRGYRRLDVTQIVSISAKHVKLHVKNQWTGDDDTFQQPGNAVIKVEGPEVTMYFLTKNTKQLVPRVNYF